MSPEERLACAIVERALMDIKGDAKPVEAEEAWAFLTDTHGHHARGRRDVCSLIGMEPDVLRECVLRQWPTLAHARRKERCPKGRTAAVLKALEERGVLRSTELQVLVRCTMEELTTTIGHLTLEGRVRRVASGTFALARTST